MKEIEINEAVFVTYHVLNSICQNFYGLFPENIENELENFIDFLIKELSKEFPKQDISNEILIQRLYLDME